MNEYESNQIDSRLRLLPKRCQIAFAASCVQRLFPYYADFTTAVGWGDPDRLRSALSYIWDYLQSKVQTDRDRVEKLRMLCDEVAPDTEEFDSPLTTPALNACAAIILTLDHILDPQLYKVTEVATLAYDTADYIAQRDLDISYTDSNFEDRISEHTVVRAEVEMQLRTLDYLQNCGAPTPEQLDRLRTRPLV